MYYMCILCQRIKKTMQMNAKRLLQNVFPVIYLKIISLFNRNSEASQSIVRKKSNVPCILYVFSDGRRYQCEGKEWIYKGWKQKHNDCLWISLTLPWRASPPLTVVLLGRMTGVRRRDKHKWCGRGNTVKAVESWPWMSRWAPCRSLLRSGTRFLCMWKLI